MGKQRLIWLDMVKGMAMILVLISHILDNRPAYLLNVPTFFLAAGYMFNPAKCADVKEYILRNTRRFLIPYVVYMLALLVINANLLPLDDPKFYRHLLLGGGYLTEVYGVFWFVTVLYVTLNLFAWLKLYKAKWWIWILILAVSYVPYYLHIRYVPWNLHVVPFTLCLIYAGYRLRGLEVPGKTWHAAVGALVIAVVCSIPLIYMLNIKYADYGCPVLTFLAMVVANCAMSVIFKRLEGIKWLAVALSYLSTASLTIMFMHQTFHYQLEAVGLNPYLVCLFALLGSTAVHYLLSLTAFTRKYFLGSFK